MVCNTKSVPIYYEVYGSGKPVLCIHGYSADHRLMTGCLEPFFMQDQSYQRIYLDLPGMGKTPTPLELKNADDMLAVIHEFIEAVIPDEKFLIIGESYGGYLTQGIVRTMQERIDGVMLICPVVNAGKSHRELPVKTILVEDENWLKSMDEAELAEFLDMAVVATKETYEKYAKDIEPGVKQADWEFLTRYGKEGYSFTFEKELENVKYSKPACIITGRQDHIVGYWDAFGMLGRFSQATYAVLDGCGHNLQIENVPLFNQHVADWLRRVKLG